MLRLTRGRRGFVGCPSNAATVRVHIAAHSGLVGRGNFVPVERRVVSFALVGGVATEFVYEECTGAGGGFVFAIGELMEESGRVLAWVEILEETGRPVGKPGTLCVGARPVGLGTFRRPSGRIEQGICFFWSEIRSEDVAGETLVLVEEQTVCARLGKVKGSGGEDSLAALAPGDDFGVARYVVEENFQDSLNIHKERVNQVWMFEGPVFEAVAGLLRGK